MKDAVTLHRLQNKQLIGYLAPNDRSSCARCKLSIPKRNGMLACTLVTPMPHVSKHGVCGNFKGSK